MHIPGVRWGLIRRPLPVFFCLLILGITSRPEAAGDAPARDGFQKILQESLETLWTGREVGPELKRRQQSMLNNGAVAKVDLESMAKTALTTIMDRHKTSRYIQKDLPERFNALFSPHINKKEFKQILWRALTSPIQGKEPFQIRIGTLAPPGTPWLTVPETSTIPEIETLSGGKILIKIYGGGVMGEDPEILKKMKDDQVDGCGCTALGVLTASPDASALLIPGLFKNYEEVDYICEKFRPDLDRVFEEKGYILAALIDTGFFYLFSKNAVTGLTDMKSQKVATWFGTVETALYQELGIVPIPVTTPELVTALSTNVVTTNLSPAAWVLGMQAHQYCRYYLKPPLLYSPAAVIVSTRMRDRLQKQIGISDVFAWNIQEVMVSEFNGLEPEWKAQIRSYEEKSLMAFETKCGIQPVVLSPQDQQVIEKAGTSLQQKLAGKVFSAKLMNDIQKALEAYRAQKQ
ncbi:MAG: TRAP transporter substrate-binding protein DctP [Thermodesulfobacteriota bacterium]